MLETMAGAESGDQRFLANHAWYDAHFSDLARKYRGQYVAVDHGQVVASSKDLSELARKVAPLEGVLVAKVVAPDEEKLVLL